MGPHHRAPAKGLGELTADELTELGGLISVEAERLEGEGVTSETVAAVGELADHP